MINRATNPMSRHSYVSKSGRRFEFEEHRIDEAPTGTNDLYVFCTEGIWGFNPLYVGKAQNLRDRLQNHERLDDAKKKGATKLLVHSEPDLVAAQLEDAETLLINELQPLLNVQKKFPMRGRAETNALAAQ